MLTKLFRRQPSALRVALNDPDGFRDAAKERLLHEVRYADLNHDEYRIVKIECEARGLNRLRRGYRVERVWDEDAAFPEPIRGEVSHG